MDTPRKLLKKFGNGMTSQKKRELQISNFARSKVEKGQFLNQKEEKAESYLNDILYDMNGSDMVWYLSSEANEVMGLWEKFLS